MILAIDVRYFQSFAIAIGVYFQHWKDLEPVEVAKVVHSGVNDYQPGAFYKRELPPIMTFLSKQERLPDTILIDGFVHIKPPAKGLGNHLYDQTNCPVIGVAKNPLKIACSYAPVYRGKSKKPLYISAIGIDLNQACDWIRSMHGKYRIPTLIKLADTFRKCQ